MRTHAFDPLGHGQAMPTLVAGALLVAVISAIASGHLLGPTDYPGFASRADSLLVYKSQRQLQVYVGGQLTRTYAVALGVNPEGPKRRRGDRRTPEGLYTIDWRNPDSDYHKALHISYPNRADKVRARRMRVNPGGNIVIHGRPDDADQLPASVWNQDWTDGCIALSNRQMDELWVMVSEGCPIRILP